MSFKLQMNTFFCNNNVCCCWLGCDDSLLFFGLCQSHETHTYIPYQSFFMNWTYPKFKFFFFGVTVEKICPKNGDSMQIFNLFDSKWWINHCPLLLHQKTLLQLQSYAISYYFAFFRHNVLYYNECNVLRLLKTCTISTLYLYREM